jgi:hypothetical protein
MAFSHALTLPVIPADKHMKPTLLLLTLSCFIIIPQLISAADCPQETKFFQATDPVRNTWEDLYRLFKTYPACDDGVFAEGYSDFVAQSLAKHWDRFHELVSLIADDSTFRDFILRHVDATADQDDITGLLNNVQTQCPSGSALFCKDIEKAALSAIEWFKK